MRFITFLDTFMVQTPNKLSLRTHVIITRRFGSSGHRTFNSTILHT
jgi:hypothetical protein